MPRLIRLAAAQMGPTSRAEPRDVTLGRLISLLEQAAIQRAQMVVFPELAFTTFFPRWLMEGDALAGYFEAAMPNPAVQPLFDRARALGVGFYVGYAELTPEGKRFNSAITVGPDGAILGKYRKVHLPGSVNHARRALPAIGKALFRLWRSRLPPPFAARRPGTAR